VVWSFEWCQRRYHIAGRAFARRKAGAEANGEKVDFVAVRKCVSGDIAGLSRNSNCVNVGIRVGGPRWSKGGKEWRIERKNREIFAIRNF
jgi:hypothetical protein